MRRGRFAHDDSHPYVPAGPNDSRSPCPALNALANHGHLPHDGRSITLTQLVSALRHVYNVSSPVAMGLSLGGLVLCGRKKPGLTFARELDLHDLARHNFIEHDGSLVHADAPNPEDKFAPTAVEPALLRQLLDINTGDLTLHDLCRFQLERHAPHASRTMDTLHARFAKGEVALLYEVLSMAPSDAPRTDSAKTEERLEPRVVPKRFLEQWLGEERLPDGWKRPAQELGFPALHARVDEIRKLQAAMLVAGLDDEGPNAKDQAPAEADV
ncbi:Cloroperoxidase [Daedaleopsis nitida]|nr:Cloroperoxidase [Daedaleopsis nitida]